MISHSWCTSHVTATSSGKIQVAFGAASIVGISTWWVGATILWIASVGDNTASTYDFHATHSKTSFCMFT
jgi:hypothetical protein